MVQDAGGLTPRFGVGSGGVEGGHTGQHLAFQQLEAGATASGDVRHLLG